MRRTPKARRSGDEKDLPAQQPQEKKEPWFQGSHAHEEWKGNPREEAAEGKETTHRLMCCHTPG